MKFLLLVTLSVLSLSAQDRCSNALSVELFGSGGLYSVNYERMIDARTSLRIGASYQEVPLSANIRAATFPFLVNRMFFDAGHQLEIGAGVVGVLRSARPDNDSFSRDVRPINGVLSLSYRDQDEEHRFLFRIGPILFFNDHGVALSGGISFGFLLQ